MNNVEIIYPDQLGDVLYDTPNATEEPKFFGFECLCGERHMFLGELILCQQQLQAFYAIQKANAAEMQAA